MKKLCLLLYFLPWLTLTAVQPNDLEFMEAFAWGNREAALQELVPDTEDYYYYHCLHYQLINDREAFHKTLDAWFNQNNRRWNSRMKEMQRRQALIEFDQKPEETWQYIQRDANLSFNHLPRNETGTVNHPSTLNPNQYSLQAFLNQAKRHDGLLNDLTQRGLEIALKEDGDPEHRRAFLGQLKRPDLPGLVDLILEDLAYKGSRGFGYLPIHSLLTLDQLEALGKRVPNFLRNQNYVTERVSRIQPPEVDLTHDHPSAISYYQELWDFVKNLGDMHTSLKASTLYRLLDHQRQMGIYNESLFKTYLEFPRQVPYLPGNQRELWQRQRVKWVNFSYQPGRNIVLPPIGTEEPLVRDFLLTLLENDANPSAYTPYFEENWLNAVFAESKILGGVGTPGEWVHLLRPAAYREILDRIELNFAAENPSYVKPGEEIELLVDIKRVDTLLVKVYEMQTFNYYQTHRAPVDQAVDLDGMVPTYERSLNVESGPGRRLRKRISLPELKDRGVYVVELIGNGVSSRALLHVGHLESITQATSAGQVMIVLNDEGQTVENAKVWMNGREYTAGKQGFILLPYSENPGERFIILQDGSFTSPETFMHLGENYDFSAGIYIDTESLQQRSTAMLLLSPDLRIHGAPLDISLLKNITVTLASTDARGTRSEREFTADFENHREWVREFYVPEGLRNLEVKVNAVIKRKSDLEEVLLEDEFSLPVNSARATDKLKQVFLQPHRGGWSLEVRGLNGEPIPNEILDVDLFHPAFKRVMDIRVATDELGQVDLGPLSEMNRIRVSGNNIQLDIPLEAGRSTLPSKIHLQTNQTVSLPYPYEREADLQAASLIRKSRGGLNLEDLRDSFEISDGELRIKGLRPGTYELTLHEPGRTLQIQVVEAENRRGFLLGETHRLQVTERLLTSIKKTSRTRDGIRIQLRNPKKNTRVAVRAYRYEPSLERFPVGFGYPAASSRKVFSPHTQYISGRNIGDEYRYVLERKFQKVFAGTLLERPGLILNPWMLRETTAIQETLKKDQAYRGKRQRMNAPAAPVPESVGFSNVQADAFSVEDSFGGGDVAGWNMKIGFDYLKGNLYTGSIGYDFMPNGSKWWVNLKPDADGNLRVPLENLDEQTAVMVVVMDNFGTTVTREKLPNKNFRPADVRLTHGLDPEKNYSRQKRIRKLIPGETVEFPDIITTRYQVIGDFSTAFDLLQTLNGDSRISDFSFLKTWPKLDQKTKLEKYGEFASHELHLFLFEKDPEFFTAFVKPYLQNKKQKTFVDRWLLDELLPEDTRLDHLQKRNALELALLARRGGKASVIKAALRDAGELLPPDPDGFSNRIRVALQANELDENESLKRDAQRNTAQKKERPESTRRVHTGVSRSLSAVSMPQEASLDMVQEEFLLEREEDAKFMEMNDAMAGEFFAEEAPRLYRALPRTKEWAEQNYYGLRIADDVAGLIPVNQFWQDIAAGENVSPHLLQSHRNLHEVLTALAFCGLPFEAEKPVEKLKDTRLSLQTFSEAILVSEQILPAVKSKDERPLLVYQQFFRPDDRYRFEENEKIEKFIDGEFIRRTVYGARVTLTNPTASRRRLNLLLQIPLGAIPLKNGFYTDDKSILLEPYTTRTVEYFFTFPESGTFDQFPAHASDEETVIGQAEAKTFQVKNRPTEVDRSSWAWISQYAGPEETLAFLEANNIRRLDLYQISWRLRDPLFFNQMIALLENRGWFDSVVYSYSVFHKQTQPAKVWLANSQLAHQVGPVFESPLLMVNPIEQKSYQHLEYDPLVNPRAHEVGDNLEILNLALRDQYRSFLHHNLYRNQLDAQEQLALVYYLQVQDRLTSAFAQLEKVNPKNLSEKIQFDYLQAWMALRRLDLDTALAFAGRYTEYPVPRWKSRFSNLEKAIEEAQGKDVADSEDPNRQQDLDQLAMREPSIELETVSGKLLMTQHNLEEVTLNLYPMDIELLFSRKPFLSEDGADFAVIKPALSQQVPVQGNGEERELQLPEEYRDQNLMVELVGKGKRASVAWYANQLKVRKMENFGQLEVRSSGNNQALPKTYVKVFAKAEDGRVSFWKDGYTDLRGRFDYLSLNNRKPEEAKEFSILVLHPEQGAEIIKAEPPTR